jgi:cyclic pyranopterin phosphate synthase
LLHHAQVGGPSTNQVDEINREMADVFGVPYGPPEGTCLGPTSEPPFTEAMLPPVNSVSTGGWGDSSSGMAGSSGQQQLPAAAVEALQELRQYTRQLQAQMQQLQHLLQRHGGGPAVPAPQQQPDTPPSSPSGWQQQQAAAAAGSTAAPVWEQQPAQQQQQLSHVDGSGRASMVDVAHKASSGRVAAASCRVLLGPEAYAAVAANAIAKGDVLRVAQIAGIQGAKATAQLIPLCHNIFISSVDVDLQLQPDVCGVAITATARAAGQTGVEMEALMGAAVAALTVYDMTKAVSKGITISELQLEYKEGGKSGVWRRQE